MSVQGVGAQRAAAAGVQRGSFDLLAARDLKLSAGEAPMAAWTVAGVQGTSSAALTLSGVGKAAGGMLMLTLSGASVPGGAARAMPALRVTGIEGPGGIVATFFGQTASTDAGDQLVDAHFAFPAKQVARWPEGARLLALVEVGGPQGGAPQRVKIPAPTEIQRG